MPAYLQIDAAGTTLTLATNDVAFVGPPVTIKFSVSLANYPSVTALPKQFIVSINCQVFSLSFLTAPALVLVEPAVTAQPAWTTFVVAQSPACSHLTTFTLLANPTTFVSLQNAGAIQTDVQVFGVVLADKGIYPFTMRASVDGLTFDTVFNVEIADPCRRAIF